MSQRFGMWCFVLSALILGMSFEVAASNTGSRQIELRVDSSGEVTLAGTLLLPAGAGPFPAVVFTHGSEPGKRGDRGYRATANVLLERGIAVLLFDKRGVGDSTGTYVEAPDLSVPADDVLAWVSLLESRNDIRTDSIGVLGWSQGGWVGPLAASRTPALAFVVSISGPGVSPLEQNIYDKTNQMRASGATKEQTQRFSEVIRSVWTYIVTGEGEAGARRAWDSVADETWFERGYNGPPMMDRDRLLAHPRMTHYVAHSTYDPGPVLRSLDVPMLALFGSEDSVVPVERSIEAMRQAFRAANNPELTVRVFDGAGHGLFVRSDNGGRSPAPGHPEYMADWIEGQTRREP